MPGQSWILNDVDRDLFVDAWQVGPADVAGAGDAQFSIRKRTLRGGLRDGVNVLEINNGKLLLVLLPDRGMGLWRGAMGEFTLGWQSPVRGPVNPRFVPLDEASGLGWLNGFDEWVCRCGLQSNGPPEWDAHGKLMHTLHGRIANLPAHYLEVTIDAQQREIAVTGIVEEARLFGNKLQLRSTLRTGWDSSAFTITDEIVNLSAQPGEFELLYHINVGAPLAVPGSRFLAPVEVLAPRDLASAEGVAGWQEYPPHQLQTPETVLYFELASDAGGRTRTLLQSPDGTQGLSLSFSRRQFPYYTLWKLPLMPADGYVTGLEPCINFPNVKSFEQSQGRVAVLSAGERRTFEIGFEVHASAADVEQAVAAIQRLQPASARVLQSPRPGWSPV